MPSGMSRIGRKKVEVEVEVEVEVKEKHRNFRYFSVRTIDFTQFFFSSTLTLTSTSLK
jgi:hypothetical protein